MSAECPIPNTELQPEEYSNVTRDLLPFVLPGLGIGAKACVLSLYQSCRHKSFRYLISCFLQMY